MYYYINILLPCDYFCVHYHKYVQIILNDSNVARSSTITRHIINIII